MQSMIFKFFIAQTNYYLWCLVSYFFANVVLRSLLSLASSYEAAAFSDKRNTCLQLLPDFITYLAIPSITATRATIICLGAALQSFLALYIYEKCLQAAMQTSLGDHCN